MPHVRVSALTTLNLVPHSTLENAPGFVRVRYVCQKSTHSAVLSVSTVRSNSAGDSVARQRHGIGLFAYSTVGRTVHCTALQSRAEQSTGRSVACRSGHRWCVAVRVVRCIVHVPSSTCHLGTAQRRALTASASRRARSASPWPPTLRRTRQRPARRECAHRRSQARQSP